MSADMQNPYILADEADTAHLTGNYLLAAQLFRHAAEMALEQDRVDLHLYFTRRRGHVLMWGGRFDEAAPCLLRVISCDGQADVSMDLVYTAMTDLCHLILFAHRYRQFRQTLSDGYEYLDHRGRRRWRHRLELLQAIAHLRRGEHLQAFAMANKAWQGMLAASDGPAYTHLSYLNHIFRAAHGLGDAQTMDATLALCRRWDESLNCLSNVRHLVCQAIRLAFGGITEENRETIRDLTRDALNRVSLRECIRDEMIVDALRLLAQAGGTDEAEEILQRSGDPDGPGLSLLSVDIGICRLTQRLGKTPPFYMVQEGVTRMVEPLIAGQPECSTKFQLLLARAEKWAQAEDDRLECSRYSQAIALRRKWLFGDCRSDMP